MNTNHTPLPWQVNSTDKFQVCDSDGEVRGCATINARCPLPIGETMSMTRGEYDMEMWSELSAAQPSCRRVSLCSQERR